MGILRGNRADSQIRRRAESDKRAENEAEGEERRVQARLSTTRFYTWQSFSKALHCGSGVRSHGEAGRILPSKER
jgi:hypothetical protein